MLRIIDVDYAGGYRLMLAFNDGTRRIADLKPYLKGEVFGKLTDKQEFTQYALTRGTIEWANGADLAPEFLHNIGKPV